MKTSATNTLKGTVLSIYPCATNATILIKLDGGEVVTASIDMDALRDMDLQVGQRAYAIFSSSSVLVGTDD